MIEITLVFQDREIDLLIPGQVTFDRLRFLIQEAFATRGVAVPDGFTLSIPAKALVVSGQELVGSSGLADGDRLQIMAKV